MIIPVIKFENTTLENVVMGAATAKASTVLENGASTVPSSSPEPPLCLQQQRRTHGALRFKLMGAKFSLKWATEVSGSGTDGRK